MKAGIKQGSFCPNVMRLSALFIVVVHHRHQHMLCIVALVTVHVQHVIHYKIIRTSYDLVDLVAIVGCNSSHVDRPFTYCYAM